MTFNSIEFLIFFPIVSILYFLLPKKARIPLLLIASYYFYMFYQAELVILILTSTGVSYLSSIMIERTERKEVRKLWLILTLTVSLGILFFFKYFNFLFGSIMSIAELLGIDTPELVLKLVLPVGISFYTFQTLSYVIDVYRGNIKAERNFLYYALFVSFFPQLVAGPIERPDNLLPQLHESHSFSRDDLTRGAQYMLLGFFKKICVADAVAMYVDSVYNSPNGASSLSIVIATLLFSVQIYCDFSGYTDIATGCARIMGIRLMKNFDHPYTALTVKDFWQRWHISLSGWFKDYLYIPLGGNRKGAVRRYFNVFLVFLLSGLWHGASFTFVIWGALHGIYRMVGDLSYPIRDRLLRCLGRSDKDRVVVVFRRIITCALVSFAWIFFRAGSLVDAWCIISRLFTAHTGIMESLALMELGIMEIILTVLSIATLIIADRLVVWGEDGRDGAYALTDGGSIIVFTFVIAVMWMLLLSKGQDSSFIYFQF